MYNCIKIEHPLVKHYLSELRDKNVKVDQFRESFRKITPLILYKATEDLLTQTKNIETPLGNTDTQVLLNRHTVIPILRAGLSMLPCFLESLPNCRIGFIGICRNDDTYLPELYYKNLPKDVENDNVIILEPMIATSGSICLALDILRNHGVKNIRVVSLLMFHGAIEKICEKFPDVKIYCCDIDLELDINNYIVPGIGDAGDRFFGNI